MIACLYYNSRADTGPNRREWRKKGEREKLKINERFSKPL
jgi:hypothetical protein